MFEIVGGRKSFFQWDLNQKLAVFDESITEVHFCNKSADCALVCEVYNGEDGARVVDVPNILLQANRCIRAYGVAADHTEHYARFEVISRSKPADYVYTETEVKTFSLLEQRVDKLENTVTTEGIAQAVEDYLKANPVEAGATAEERAQITQNAKDISGLYEQAAGFALKSEIPKVDLTPYALKTEIPVVPANVSAFANDAGYTTTANVKAIVEDQLGEIELPSGGEEWEVIFGPEYVNGSGASCVTKVEAEGTTKVTQALGAYYKKLYVRLNGQADAFCTAGKIRLDWGAANSNWHNLQEQKGTATWTDLWWIVEFHGAFIQVRTAAGNAIQNRRSAGAKYDKTNNLVLTTTTSSATFHNFGMEIWGVKA